MPAIRRQRHALPAGTQAAVLASLVMAVIQGMSVLARDGATRASLLGTAEMALRAWPPQSPAGTVVATSPDATV